MVAATVSRDLALMAPMAKRRSAVMFGGAVAGADGAAVLVPVPVEDVVAAVLDGPVTAVEGQDGGGIGAVRGVVGEAVDGFGGGLAGGFLDGVRVR